MLNYNRYNQAMFTVITDGREWRFYYSQASGVFSKRCFETFDLRDDDLDDVVESFTSFLSKSEIVNENAKRKAEDYLRLNEVNRAMEDCLPEARRLINESPLLNLVEALIKLVAQSKGLTIKSEQALAFISEAAQRKPVATPPPITNTPPDYSTQQPVISSQARQLIAEQPESLTFSSFLGGKFGSENATTWNDLVHCAVRTVLRRGISLQAIQDIAPVRTGIHTTEGYSPVRGTEPQVSVRGLQANSAWRASLRLAQQARLGITARFRWENNPNAAHPGQEGFLQWSP